MTRQPGEKPILADPSRLEIRDIPRLTLEDLSSALGNFIYWHTRMCVTRIDRISRDQSFIRLRQSQWHVDDALKNLVEAHRDQERIWPRLRKFITRRDKAA